MRRPSVRQRPSQRDAGRPRTVNRDVVRQLRVVSNTVRARAPRESFKVYLDLLRHQDAQWNRCAPTCSRAVCLTAEQCNGGAKRYGGIADIGLAIPNESAGGDLPDVKVESRLRGARVSSEQERHDVPAPDEAFDIGGRHLLGTAAEVQDVGEVDRVLTFRSYSGSSQGPYRRAPGAVNMEMPLKKALNPF